MVISSVQVFRMAKSGCFGCLWMRAGEGKRLANLLSKVIPSVQVFRMAKGGLFRLSVDVGGEGKRLSNLLSKVIPLVQNGLFMGLSEEKESGRKETRLPWCWNLEPNAGWRFLK